MKLKMNLGISQFHTLHIHYNCLSLPFYKFKLFFWLFFVKYLIGVVIYEFQGEVGRSAKGEFT